MKMKTAINTKVVSSNQSLLDKSANWFLTPLRYICKGRNIELIHNRCVGYREAGIETSRIKRTCKTALALFVLYPSLAVGGSLKVIALRSKKVNKLYAPELSHYKHDHQQYIEIPELDRRFVLVDAKLQALCSQVKSRKDWTKPKVIKQMSLLMEEANQAFEAMHNDVFKRVEKVKLARAKVNKAARLFAEHDYEWGMPAYYFNFFHGNVTDVYHVARGCFDGKSYPHLIRDEQKAYFIEGTPQHRWRQIYNNFCDKIEKDGFRTALRRSDMKAWSVKDTDPVDGVYGNPSERPAYIVY